MVKPNEAFASDTTEHLVEQSQFLPPHFRVRKNRSNVWNHFTKELKPNLEKKARRNYCEGLDKFENGTTDM